MTELPDALDHLAATARTICNQLDTLADGFRITGNAAVAEKLSSFAMALGTDVRNVQAVHRAHVARELAQAERNAHGFVATTLLELMAGTDPKDAVIKASLENYDTSIRDKPLDVERTSIMDAQS